jgi:outer membrane protein assembly factor BamD (BamD/ComL family)
MKHEARLASNICIAAACLLSLLCGRSLTGLAASSLGGLYGQQGVGRGSIATPHDPELEKQSIHSLEVAQYYYKRKPTKNDKESAERLNKAVESRLMEIIDLNPNFSRMDEVYFLLGEVYKRTGDRDKQQEYLNKLLKEFPDSQFAKDAKLQLDALQAQSTPKKDH